MIENKRYLLLSSTYGFHNETIGSNSAGLLQIVLLLSVIDTASNYLLSVKAKNNAEFFNKSQEIIRNSGILHKAIIEMQSSFRGLDTNILDGYKKGQEDIPGLFTEQENV